MPPTLVTALLALVLLWVVVAFAIELLAWRAEYLARLPAPARFRLAPVARGDASQARLAFLGDVQRGIADIARPLAQAMEDEPADLLISSGDLIAHGEAPYYGVFLDAFDRAEIQGPLRVVPGNHDLHPRRFRDATQAYALFRERFGEPYWAERVGPVLVVGVDDAVRAVNGEQLTWLDEVLAERGDTPWITVCHRPPRDLFEEEAPVAGGCDALVDRMERHPPLLCVCGHEHEYLERQVGGVRYVVNAHGGDVHGLGLSRGPFDLLRVVVSAGGSTTERITRHKRRPWRRVYLHQLAVRAWWSRRKGLGAVLAAPASLVLGPLGLRAPLRDPRAFVTR